MCEFDITFLGTCACDFSPRLKTDLKDKFDKDVRRSSSILMGNRLVDCGTHTVNSLGIIGKPLSEITDIFVTHTHDDHFEPENIALIAQSKKEKLNLWVREDAVFDEIPNTNVIRMEVKKQYDVDGELKITSLNANHTYYPQHFVFEKGGKNMFYGPDGGWLLADTFRFLKRKYFDLMILDCTMGDYEADLRIAEHNSIPMLRIMLKSFEKLNVIDEKTQIYMSHLAPSLHKPHAETEKICEKFGAHVAYDGLRIKV